MGMRYVPASLLMIAFGLIAAAPGADEVVTVEVHVDSHYQGCEGHRAMDADPGTIWHTGCQFYETRRPHEILINLARNPIQNTWYASYNNLLPYAFTDYGNNLRTIPGQFGARASRLLDILDKGH